MAVSALTSTVKRQGEDIERLRRRKNLVLDTSASPLVTPCPDVILTSDYVTGAESHPYNTDGKVIIYAKKVGEYTVFTLYFPAIESDATQASVTYTFTCGVTPGILQANLLDGVPITGALIVMAGRGYIVGGPNEGDLAHAILLARGDPGQWDLEIFREGGNMADGDFVMIEPLSFIANKAHSIFAVNPVIKAVVQSKSAIEPEHTTDGTPITGTNILGTQVFMAGTTTLLSGMSVISGTLVAGGSVSGLPQNLDVTGLTDFKPVVGSSDLITTVSSVNTTGGYVLPGLL
jgi:hypothetical protein